MTEEEVKKDIIDQIDKLFVYLERTATYMDIMLTRIESIEKHLGFKVIDKKELQ